MNYLYIFTYINVGIYKFEKVSLELLSYLKSVSHIINIPRLETNKTHNFRKNHFFDVFVRMFRILMRLKLISYIRVSFLSFVTRLALASVLGPFGVHLVKFSFS